jgi:hypothetical protein
MPEMNASVEQLAHGYFCHGYTFQSVFPSHEHLSAAPEEADRHRPSLS